MSGNSFGTAFKLTSFGESHGAAIGGVIDGCPAGFKIDLDAIQSEMNRRRPGQSSLTSPRKEADQIEWLSGIFEGQTTGAPIGFIIRNQDVKSEDYDHLRGAYRPSHADFTYAQKYGVRDHRGGGRSSARETAARVVAGAVARQILGQEGLKLSAYVSRVQEIAFDSPPKWYAHSEIDRFPVRCPDASTAHDMESLIESTRLNGDTVGGSITLVANGMPIGLGEPVFDKLQACLAHALWSLPAVKYLEIGSGKAGTYMFGSNHNDVWTIDESGQPQTGTNHSGGIQGGISNGQDLILEIGFKPVSTIMQSQKSINENGEEVTIAGKGRHDPCVLPRAVPLVEAMTLLVLMDLWLKNRTSRLSD